MASRSRHSTAAATPAPSQPSSTQRRAQAGIPLPTYETPSQPLNPQGQTALTNLTRSYPAQRLHDKLKRAAAELADRAADINELLANKENATKRRHTKRDKQQRERAEGREQQPLSEGALERERVEDERKDEELSALRVSVRDMTARMERQTHSIVDSQKGIEHLQVSLRELSSSSAQATQRLQSQAQSEAPDITQPGETQDENAPCLVPDFQDSLTTRAEAYSSLKPRIKYAQHPFYIQFKSVVHDAHYPDGNGPPLPHHSHWFSVEDGGSPLPEGRVNSNTQDAGDEDDSDSDIEIQRANIQTTCPITLCELVEPIKSSKCPHMFERQAIENMIKAQRPPTRGRNAQQSWTPEVQCPVPGCDVRIGMDDLVHDVVAVRRIRRVQKKRQDGTLHHGFGDDVGEDSQMAGRDEVEEVNSDSGDDIDALERRATQIKNDPNVDDISD